MTEREALKLLVEVFGGGDWHEEIVDSAWADKANKAIASAKEVLAQPERSDDREQSDREQEPVAWLIVHKSTKERFLTTQPNNWDSLDWFKYPLYTTPQKSETFPQRTWEKPWVSLTDEEREELMDTYDVASTDYAQAIEAKLKEKNT